MMRSGGYAERSASGLRRARHPSAGVVVAVAAIPFAGINRVVRHHPAAGADERSRLTHRRRTYTAIPTATQAEAPEVAPGRSFPITQAAVLVRLADGAVPLPSPVW
jgi:hypothetical protein